MLRNRNGRVGVAAGQHVRGSHARHPALGDRHPDPDHHPALPIPRDLSPGDPDPPERRRFDLLPLLALVAIVLLLVAGWLLFPWLQRTIGHEDCVAAGYTNCGGATP